MHSVAIYRMKVENSSAFAVYNVHTKQSKVRVRVVSLNINCLYGSTMSIEIRYSKIITRSFFILPKLF